MKLPEAIRKWKFIATDWNDENHILGDDTLFVGSEKEAFNRCKLLSDAWEEKNWFLCKTVMESQGIMWQGPGKQGGL